MSWATGEPSDNLYVTNLPCDLDDSMVMEFFSIYGTVTSTKVLKNPIASGKTAALVRFSSIEEASSILETLNGTVPTGLDEPVQVKFAAKKDATKGFGKAGMGNVMAAVASALGSAGYGSGDGWGASPAAKGGWGKWDGGGAAYGGAAASPYVAAGAAVKALEPEISDNIYVQGLPAGTTEESLRLTFMEFGNIKTLKLLPSRTPESPCAALIRYDSTETAKLTKEILNGQTPEGFPGPLKVRYANQPGVEPAAAWGGAAAGKGAWAAQGAWAGAGAGAAALKGAWQAPQQQWDASWQSKGKGQSPVAAAGGLTTAQLVDMVYASNMLPGGSKYHNDRASLYVGGLPGDVTDVHLYKMFSPYGAIHSSTTKYQGSGENTWSIGFVNYLDPASADAAITAYNGMSLPDGNTLKVTIKTAPVGKG